MAAQTAQAILKQIQSAGVDDGDDGQVSVLIERNGRTLHADAGYNSADRTLYLSWYEFDEG